MTTGRIRLAAVLAAVALLLSMAIPAQGAPRRRDRTPPTAPQIVYSQGFFCFVFYVGATKSRDNRTPEPELRYEVFANGEVIGLLNIDNGSTRWGNLKLQDEGPNSVFVEAVDAAGNRARSGTNIVTGFDCEI